MDSTGREHLVHSTLLRLKIPLFRYMEIEPSSTILMDFASPEVVEFLCEVVYGSDRWFNQIVTLAGVVLEWGQIQHFVEIHYKGVWLQF